MREHNPDWNLQVANTMYSLLGTMGGASVNLVTKEYNHTSGYFVFVQEIAKYKNLVDVCTATIASKLPDYPGDYLYLGACKNPDTNEYEIELSVKVDSVGEAFIIAKQFNQKYVYDAANDKNIKVERIWGK